MDHLPILSSSIPPKVPHLRLFKYDGRGYEGYLERQQLTENDLRSRNKEVLLQPGAAESCLQEWLFFSVLHDVTTKLGLPINVDELSTENEDGSASITTRPIITYAERLATQRLMNIADTLLRRFDDLSTLLAVLPADLQGVFKSHLASHFDNMSWRDAVKLNCYLELDWPPNEAVRIEVQQVINSARLSLKLIHTAWLGPQRLDQFGPQSLVFSSIAILLETLETLLGNTYGMVDLDGQVGPELGEIWRERMRNGGWCPSHIESITQGSTTLAYAASQLKAYDQRDHRRCEVDRCLVEPQTLYERGPTHDANSCPGDCLSLAINESEVVRILKADSIPVISLDSHSNESDLIVRDVAEVESFVAISHVWSHGLGNPTENALCSCRLKALFESVHKISGQSAAIWIDSLCVPVSEVNKPFRKLAIQKLRSLYSTAPKVLVVDERLRHVGNNLIEQKIHVLCCEWMRRLWTLQEGCLPKPDRLYIEFQADIVPLSSLLEQSETKIADNLRPLLAMEPIARDERINSSSLDLIHDLNFTLTHRLNRQFLAEVPHRLNRLMGIVQSLAKRSTTRASDEAICLATLMNVSLEQFDSLPTMEQVLAKVEIPTDILFVPGPRLLETPYGWAPRTFLEIGIIYSFSQEVAQQTSRGLLVCRPTLKLDSPFSLRPGSTVAIKTAGERIDYDFLVPLATERFAVLTETRTFDSATLICAQARESSRRGLMAVLVSNCIDEGGITYGKYELSVSMTFFGSEQVRDSSWDQDQVLRAHYEAESRICIS